MRPGKVLFFGCGGRKNRAGLLAAGGFFLWVLAAPAPAMAQETPPREVQDYGPRIQRLERAVDRLEREVQRLEDVLADRPGRGPAAVVDPLWGTWKCTNNVFDYGITFQRNGQAIQTEATFGNARNAQWTRLDDDRISLSGGVVLTTDFSGPDEMTVVDSRNQTAWTCRRQ